MLFPSHAPTTMQTGLYGYDLEHRGRVNDLGAQRDAAMARPVIGAGGVNGAALGQRVTMEAAFLQAVEEANRRRAMAEAARRTQEADIAGQRRAQAERLGGAALGNVAEGVVAGVAALAPVGGQKRRGLFDQNQTGGV